MAKQTKNGRTIKVTFFVHELQDFIENTHTHTHTHTHTQQVDNCQYQKNQKLWFEATNVPFKKSDLKQPMFLLN